MKPFGMVFVGTCTEKHLYARIKRILMWVFILMILNSGNLTETCQPRHYGAPGHRWGEGLDSRGSLSSKTEGEGNFSEVMDPPQSLMSLFVLELVLH